MPTTRGKNPLLPSKQREVAQLVRAAGFSKTDIDFEDYAGDDNTDVTALIYRAEPEYRFVFYPDEPWKVGYSPGDSTHWVEDVPGDWANVLQRVGWWLDYLRRETSITDPWAAIFESVESFNIGGDPDDNSPFSSSERDYIKRELAEIKSFLLDQGLKADADRHAVMTRLDYLEDGIDRLGRRDWVWFALGLLMQLVFIGWVTPEGVRFVVEHWFSEGRRLLGA